MANAADQPVAKTLHGLHEDDQDHDHRHHDLGDVALVAVADAEIAETAATLSMTIARNGANQTLNVPVTRACAFRLYVYGSPEYLARHAPIKKRSDLAGHDFVDYVQRSEEHTSELQSR